MNQPSHPRWLRWSLTAIAGLLAVIALELSVLLPPLQPSAVAQIPDSGLQRRQQLEAQDKTNLLLDQILQFLRTQTIKVKVVSTDKDSKAESKEAPRAGRK